MLHAAGGGGHQRVGGQGGHDARADLVGGDAGVFQSPAGGQHRHVGDGLTLRQVVAVGDAGAGGDPLVIGVHDLGHVLIGDQLGGDASAGPQDLDSVHCSSLSGAAAPSCLNF